MAKALVTCPATTTTELIEFVETPLGSLIHACSRFQPTTALACGRTCASGSRCKLAEVKKSNAEIDDDEDDDEDTAIDVEVSALISLRVT